MSALPSSVSYQQGAPSLPPNARATDVVLRPTNGATFGENATISWDFNNAGFIVPDSLHIRYKYAFTNAVSAEMRAVPVYTPFQTLRAYIGSNQVETIASYHQTMNMLVNVTHDVGQKYGLMNGYGYFGSTGVPSLEALDGRILSAGAVNETGSFSAPLPCMFSNCDKMIPAFALPQLRLELVVATLTDMFKATPAVTGMVLSNVELCYTQVDMGDEVERAIKAMGVAHIKTHSFVNSGSTLSSGSAGQVALVYNQRLASIKSAFLVMPASATASNNGIFDSFDITSNNGSYQFTIAGKNYPQTALSTSQNKAGIFQALRSAVGSIYSKDNNCAINAVEFGYISNPVPTTSTQAPAKFYVGADLEVISSDYILSGISSQNSSISVNVTLGTATGSLHTIVLILNYDALLEIDFGTGQASVKM